MRRTFWVLALGGLMLGHNAWSQECSLSIDGNDQIQFSTKELRVSKSCKEVTVTLKHVGQLAANVMGHNWVLTATADYQAVAAAGQAAAGHRRAAVGRVDRGGACASEPRRVHHAGMNAMNDPLLLRTRRHFFQDCALGVGSIALAWYHAGNTSQVWIQNQELLSGGVGGLALVLLGIGLLVYDGLARTRAADAERWERVLEVLEQQAARADALSAEELKGNGRTAARRRPLKAGQS